MTARDEAAAVVVQAWAISAQVGLEVILLLFLAAPCFRYVWSHLFSEVYSYSLSLCLFVLESFLVRKMKDRD